MDISQIMEKMITISDGNIHDIDRFIRVWTYAKTIGELEHLDRDTQYILEVAAIAHDIAIAANRSLLAEGEAPLGCKPVRSTDLPRHPRLSEGSGTQGGDRYHLRLPSR